jgi:hypothetical protein
MKTLKVILAIAVLAIIGYYAYEADFYVWRLQHPQAPTWTYFFSR